MPCFGSAALIVSRAEAAKSSPHPPVYILGVGQSSDRGVPGIAYAERMTTSPVAVSARNAFKMAGLGPNDMDMASVYDCYTITVIIEFEDAGFAPKGEGGKYFASEDVTYKSKGIAVNTHGGQLSFGQPGTAGGMSHATEAVRQLMGRGEGRQKEQMDYCFVNG
jgi:acetyl-CoA acetyltransferase